MGQKLLNIRFNMQLPVVITKKERLFVSYCPAIDVASQGITEDEAKNNLIEAVSLFLVTCFEMGTLDAVLKECGFVPGISLQETSNPSENVDYIDVPLPFMIDMGTSHRCHA